jgi:transcriptional regulator with XRE-family HTH domain
MKRTRKWTFVAQEATRLTELGLSPREIAQRLGLSKSTVTRWIAAGKLIKPAVTAQEQPWDLLGSQTAVEWAAIVRKDYALDATDDQLVSLAEAALTAARDPQTDVRLALVAMGRFQAIVKQLALVPRLVVEEPDAAAEPAPVEPPASRIDPRVQMMKDTTTIQ